MTQKDVARMMDMTPRQVRYVINSLRVKGYPVLASKGMFLSENEEATMDEVRRLNKTAVTMTMAAKGMFYGVKDKELTDKEKELLSLLPVLKEDEQSEYDSSKEFEFIKE